MRPRASSVRSSGGWSTTTTPAMTSTSGVRARAGSPSWSSPRADSRSAEVMRCDGRGEVQRSINTSQRRSMVKLVFTLRRREDMTRAEFQRYWRERHALLVKRHADALHIRRYVQVHARDTDLDEAVAGARDG